MTTVDAVVIGAGPNGLVAANDLADHGGRLTFRGKAAHPYDATIDDPKVARVVRRAVCRSSYVHPRISETFNTGELANRWTCQAPRSREASQPTSGDSGNCSHDRSDVADGDARIVGLPGLVARRRPAV